MSITWNTDADMTPAQAQAEHAAQEAVRWAVRDALLAAPDGMTNLELFDVFGPSAVKRLNDLKRHHGYSYTREYIGPRTWLYRLQPPTAAVPSRPKQTRVPHLRPFGPDADRIVAEAARILRARRAALAAAPRPATLF